MSDPPRIVAELTFLTSAQGGRSHAPPQPPWDEGWYMPHAIAVDRAEYLGVRFVGGPAITAGEPGRFELALMYPEVDYSAPQPGVAIAAGRVPPPSPRNTRRRKPPRPMSRRLTAIY